MDTEPTETKQGEQIFYVKVEDLDLSPQTVECLKGEKKPIKYVGDLVLMDPVRLRMVHGIGWKRFREIESAVWKLGWPLVGWDPSGNAWLEAFIKFREENP